MRPAVGEKAPAFSASDQSGIVHTLSENSGSWLILYFYPEDDTSGCTTEACNFRDNLSALQRNKVKVFGVSPDSIASHRKFVDKYALPFPLLADEDKKIMTLYGVWMEKSGDGERKYMGVERATFLINPEGTIKKVYEKVKPEEHIDEVLRDLKTLV